MLLDIRTERQWKAAVRKAASVETLMISGPEGLTLEGVEGMVGLKRVYFDIDGPMDGLWRLGGLPALEEVLVAYARKDVDVEGLLSLRVPSLMLDAHRARPAMELARLPLEKIDGLERLHLGNMSYAVLPLECRKLLEQSTLSSLDVSGYALSDGSWRALLAAKGLRQVLIDDDGERSEERTRELRAALPDAEEVIVRRASLGSEEGPPWPLEDIDRTTKDGGVWTRLTLGPEQVAQMASVPPDAAALVALLGQWAPALRARVEITASPRGIAVASPSWYDLRFIQDLLESGPPGTPSRFVAGPVVAPIDNPHLAAFVAHFLEEVRAGRFDEDVDAASVAWAAGLRKLEADGVDDHEDTAVREQLFDLLREPLGAAGLDAETVVLSS